jgi:hypothetical protein
LVTQRPERDHGRSADQKGYRVGGPQPGMCILSWLTIMNLRRVNVLNCGFLTLSKRNCALMQGLSGGAVGRERGDGV